MHGELDQDTGPQLGDAVEGALRVLPASGEPVVDMSGVTFRDSGGLN